MVTLQRGLVDPVVGHPSQDLPDHLAFGLGIHRCVGSNLARMELRVALECFLAAFPEFGLDPGATVTWARGQVRGPRTLPLRIG